MKYSLIVTAMLVVSGCSTVSIYDRQAREIREQAVTNQKAVVSNMPNWFTTPPSNSTNVIYATGTSASNSISVAENNAVNIALGKICNSSGASTSQNSNFLQKDTNGESFEIAETVIKTKCSAVNATGFAIHNKSVIVEPSGKARVYILVALPLGDVNFIASRVNAAKTAKKIEDQADKIFTEEE